MIFKQPPRAGDGLRARLGGVWTAHKLFYLQRYATAFMVAMDKKKREGRWKSLVYIDLLAGPGFDKDRRSGDEFPGSPLIAIRTRPPFDRIYLGDLGLANVKALRRRIPTEDEVRVDLKRADCHDRARVVINSLSPGTLGLAFVDPEGFEVRFSLLQTLSTRPIDIVMLFPSGIGIKRNIPIFAREEESPRMDALWGGDIWRELPVVKAYAGRPLMPQDMERLQVSWVSAYRERVESLGYLHHDSIGPLCNEQGAPMYHLLFFSKSEAGLTIWRGIRDIKPGGQRWLPGINR